MLLTAETHILQFITRATFIFLVDRMMIITSLRISGSSIFRANSGIKLPIRSRKMLPSVEVDMLLFPMAIKCLSLEEFWK
jgi:hypothetical protein